ncbi:MAG: diacylglyceryl transferase [Proteobacteria bacterium]|nr:MAG: diacylglyceryl transferase [Pseudomonadota bacterium]
MIPYLELPSFNLFGEVLQPYTYLVMLGMALCFVLAQRRVKQVGLYGTLSAVGLFWIAVGGFLGAHVVDVIAYHPERLAKNPWILLSIWDGLSSFGGFLGGSLAFWIYCKRQGIWMLAYLDALVFGFAPGWIIARGGCFAAHDHPGWPSDFFLAVAYPGGARHDLGLYELLVAVAITAVLYLLPKRRRFVGFYIGLGFVLYGSARFGLDFLRAIDVRYLQLTPAQWLSIGMVAIGVTLLVRGPQAGYLPDPAAEAQLLEEDDQDDQD